MQTVQPSPRGLGSRLSRRAVLTVGLGAGAVAVGGWERQRRHKVLPLLQADFGTADNSGWLAGGTVPSVAGLPGTLIRDALRDLRRLSLVGGGVPVAGTSGPWRYVWPRDSAFAATAFARTGHLDDAVRIIDFLQSVQGDDGRFQARYRPDTGTPPDDRGVQLDGTGWALWATWQVARQLPSTRLPWFLADHDRLLRRSTRLLEDLAAADDLPVSPDYWETQVDQPTLATAAVLSAGLDAAVRLTELVGQPDNRLARVADGFRTKIISVFAPDGYPRQLGGPASSVDLGLCFLLPPFGSSIPAGAERVWSTVRDRLKRPAGGLAPGGSWRHDGISWTNATATVALTDAALGRRQQAIGGLRWIDRHRTPSGSIPEKVLWDGRPAAVAPLAWSAAAVVITAAELANRTD